MRGRPRKRRWEMAGLLGEPDPIQEFPRPPAHRAIVAAGESARQEDVLESAQPGHQIEGLEDEADLSVAIGGERALTEGR